MASAPAYKHDVTGNGSLPPTHCHASSFLKNISPTTPIPWRV
ncbi:hypothetical protein predicted by Glimmer/Critica [Acetobacter ghanensis]|uniref:Uncharacterized protein n=1 Tax=Acetobacter ghanensis TaxID=431306 RepID=A0A0U5F5E9_9PROT|nr:hypothetical protein predicted by Glimmer/Critica [Acetobacter ghanensis]